jgi:two-component system OmpR family sensor kinase
MSGGEDWRTYTRIEGGRTIEVAQRTVVREEFAADAALRAVIPIVALVPLSWLLVGFVVTRALRPLRSVIMELRQWGQRAQRPLSLAGVPAEILPLAAATNDLVVRLQAQVEFREQFISDAAHELRTPLTALSLQVRNLGNGTLSPQRNELVAEMRSGVLRMSDMVAKLLQLARADTQQPRRATAINLGDAIAASLQTVLPMAIDKAIDIGVAQAEPETILADADDLRILIGNLVDNAVRYTPHGGAVDLSVRKTDDEVVLEVRDTGPGIAEHLLQKAFGRFVRLSSTDADGSGLGLAIVRAIAERCGARVTLANRADRPGLVAQVVFSAAAATSRTA